MFKNLEKYRQCPIPELNGARESKKGYRAWRIASDDPHSAEVCTDVRDCCIAGMNHYHRSDNPPYYRSIPGSTSGLLLRLGVIEKLQKVNARLRETGLELFLHDAWRPAAVQNYFHDVWFPARLKEQFPDLSESERAREVEKYWASGPARQEDIDPLSPPPHATGAAVDLSIRKLDGELLWMGTIFDDVTARAHSDFLERSGDIFSFSDDEARKNRRLLYWLMTEEGFANNPTEWWHYSWGDQMWAKLSSACGNRIDMPAWYSVADPLSR